jgi:hypothetical protein
MFDVKEWGRIKSEGGEWADKEQRTVNNVAACCGDSSWLLSRIIIFGLIWRQVTQLLLFRNEVN